LRRDSRRTIARVACGGNLNLPWLLHSVVPHGYRSGLTTGSSAYGMLTRRHVGPRERPWQQAGSAHELVLLMCHRRSLVPDG
jgi:hypothetical protein